MGKKGNNQLVLQSDLYPVPLTKCKYNQAKNNKVLFRCKLYMIIIIMWTVLGK